MWLVAGGTERQELMQASGSLGTQEQAAEAEELKQKLTALQTDQEGLKRQLVDLQRAEAGHLQTISEVPHPQGLPAIL